MSYGTPTKPKIVPCKNRDNMNKHAFSIQEINDVFTRYSDCLLFGSAAVWVYAEYYGVPHVGLTGEGSDIDLIDPGVNHKYDDTFVSENGMQCRHIDLVPRTVVGASTRFPEQLKAMTNVLQVEGYIIRILSITALIKAYNARKMHVMEWVEDMSKMPTSSKQKIQKIDFRLKILQDVQAKMSTRPETDGVAYAQFKF